MLCGGNILCAKCVCPPPSSDPPLQVGDGKHGKMLSPIGGLPARGFVNSIALARSGRFLLAGMGQEPRLGRWARDPGAKNCVLIHQLQLEEES